MTEEVLQDGKEIKRQIKVDPKELIMKIGVDGIGLNYLLVKIGATAIVMVYNFITRKKFLE